MKKIIFILSLFLACSLSAQETGRYKIKVLEINSKNSDFGVAFVKGNKVVFSSARKGRSIRNRKWSKNKQPYLKLYSGEWMPNAQEIASLKELPKKINTKFHVASATISPDGEHLYFTSNNYIKEKFKLSKDKKNKLQIYKVKIKGEGDFGEPESLEINHPDYSVAHPMVSLDGTKLFFCSDMPGSMGGTDIYVAEILEDGSVGEPINLGPNVNSIYNEMFPFMGGDNVLYFSSDRKESLGGLDVFGVRVYPNGKCSMPKRLSSPINSIADDFAFVINADEDMGFVSSNRKGGVGSDDIYFFEEEEPIAFICTQKIRGIVKQENGPLLPGSLVDVKSPMPPRPGEDMPRNMSILTGGDGGFIVDVDCDAVYEIQASRDYHSPHRKKINTTYEVDKIHVVQFILKPDEFMIKDGVKFINTNKIYFDFNKSNIRPDAAMELDKVVAIMQKYPSIMIDVRSYTDSRGSESYNLELSDERMVSTIKYLVDHGIPMNRLTGQGYGDRFPINKCKKGVKCTDEEQEMNRRTEFVVIKE
ncbi:OmpA family protein [Aureivirga sp. CE67]|uniref:OmpA family protein n=1 Tax=Aureivirga sp. CE67 TaxID=1788983 RepID=UPI0018C93024|nr:OmpA family protein [Aureivirga sp. CE67]